MIFRTIPFLHAPQFLYKFCLQKDNVRNQKEHLVLLLANIQMRKRSDPCNRDMCTHMIHSTTVKFLMERIFQNYSSWCQYLDFESSIRDASKQQAEVLYIGLFMLIWGEASNVRFMPECLCYIFHHMARELHSIISDSRQEYFDPLFQSEGTGDAFLLQVIKPVYNVLNREASRSQRGTVSHSMWRNYDDINEYFWSKKHLTKLGWPMNPTDDLFVDPIKIEDETQDYAVNRQRITKTNFVEVRTFLHLFRSFGRMWAFLILTFQSLVILSWSPSRSPLAIFDPDVSRNVLTIFMTSAFLDFLQAIIDIVLNWKAWRSLERKQRIRYILKLVIGIAWLIILLTAYLKSDSIYNFMVSLYLLPSIFNLVLFIFQPIRLVERSNYCMFRFHLWWTQPKSFVAQELTEDIYSRLNYMLFWILLLIFKLTFSFYFEISPVVGPTRIIMSLGVETYEWHELPMQNNLTIVIILWAPIVMIYFVDTLIWYTVLSTLYGGVNGAFSRLGEIRTLGMLRLRFEAIPRAFIKHLRPNHCSQFKGHQEEKHFDDFVDIWNAFIGSLRQEDLLSNREKTLLIIPSFSNQSIVFQWPLFLLASKIPVALDMAMSVKKKDEELIKRIEKDFYSKSAVIECYNTLLDFLYKLITEPHDLKVVDQIRQIIKDSIQRQTLMKEFRLDQLPQLIIKFDELLNLLKADHNENDPLKTKVSNMLQDIMKIITQDIMKNGQGILNDGCIQKQHFANINLESLRNSDCRKKCARLQLLLTRKESCIDVPKSTEARRRIIFFANSLFMKMPRAPPVHRMMSFSVLTPFYKEEVIFSQEDLHGKNEDGISILFYLQNIFSDEWKNFRERIDLERKDEAAPTEMDVRLWASFRGQTLIRTVRGMMYYRKALEIQCIQDMQELGKLGCGKALESSEDYEVARAIVDIKFTYVVSCQAYGTQKISKDKKDKNCFLNTLILMKMNPSLRVAYIDEVEALTGDGKMEKMYYSVLVKAATKENTDYDEEIYRIKLPGKPTDIGEGKPENQNHAIIFTRGEALQAIDMNQDNYMEEAFKIRNLLEEFESRKYGKRKPTILGLREHIFTGSVSSLGWFMSNQETSFVTIGQRVLANPLKVRLHYGHPDIFDRLFHITRGGISKASRTINLSEDIFAGFNSTMRGGTVTHHEYIQVGKGRDVGMNQIYSFEAKVSSGNGEQTLSREVCRLGRGFDFFRMLSFYFTTVGFYFSSMVTVLTIYLFLYGRLYLVMSGFEKSILMDPRFQQNAKALENALHPPSVWQLGMLLVLPMVMEVALEKGFRTAVGEFIVMQLQFASVFFTFHLGTKAHYYGRTLLHGGAHYKPTGRGFGVHRAKFAENYRIYSRSHFGKALELLILLIVDQAYGSTYCRSNIHVSLTSSIWFLVASWLTAPFVFNPSCFEWQKTVDDWTDWWDWMDNQGGLGTSVEKSWEAWWISEQEHLRKTSVRARLMEIILSLRFMLYQYSIVYHLNITNHDRSIWVYLLSWLAMVAFLGSLKVVSWGRRVFGMELQFMFRIIKAIILILWFGLLGSLSLTSNLTMSDVFAGILALVPTGWCILLLAQACSPMLKKTMLWGSIVELAWVYESMMGFVLFLPIVVLSWFPFVSEFQTRLLFNQAFSRGLQISRILAGQKEIRKFE